MHVSRLWPSCRKFIICDGSTKTKSVMSCISRESFRELFRDFNRLEVNWITAISWSLSRLCSKYSDEGLRSFAPQCDNISDYEKVSLSIVSPSKLASQAPLIMLYTPPRKLIRENLFNSSDMIRHVDSFGYKSNKVHPEVFSLTHTYPRRGKLFFLAESCGHLFYFAFTARRSYE